MVDLPARPEQPLRAALLVPVREPTHRNPAGDFVNDDLAGLLASTGSLGAIADELARSGTPEVTMVVDAMLVEDATAMVGGWRLRQPGAGGPPSPPLTGAPATPTSSSSRSRRRPAAMRRRPSPMATPISRRWSGRGAAARPRGDRGRAQRAHKRARHGPGESLAWPVDGAVDGALLRTLEQTGGDVVVLDPRHLPAPEAAVTQNATVDLGGGPNPQRALVGDAGLSAALSDPRAASAPVEWAQRILAETAVVWLERPNSAGPRGILLAPPQGWRPSGTFFRSLVRGLRAASWLGLQQAAALADDVPQGPAEGERRLATVTASDITAGLPPPTSPGSSRSAPGWTASGGRSATSTSPPPATSTRTC